MLLVPGRYQAVHIVTIVQAASEGQVGTCYRKVSGRLRCIAAVHLSLDCVPHVHACIIMPWVRILWSTCAQRSSRKAMPLSSDKALMCSTVHVLGKQSILPDACAAVLRIEVS